MDEEEDYSMASYESRSLLVFLESNMNVQDNIHNALEPDVLYSYS